MEFPESPSWLSRATLAFFSAVFLCFFVIYIRPASMATASDPGYPPITPLPSFTWSTTPPLIFRPFKPKYHLTMGISDLNYSDLIPMDKTYLSRLDLRRQLLAQYPDVVRGVNIQNSDDAMHMNTNGKIGEALCEWYAYVMGVYLPTRFPGMFRVVKPGFESEPEKRKLGLGGKGSDERKGKAKGAMLESSVTGLKVPIDPDELMRMRSSSDSAPASEKEKTKQGLLYLLDTLGTWVDEDFLILLPAPVSVPTTTPTSPTTSTTSQNPTPSQEQKYHLQAYTTYYPAGFDTRTKISRPLNEIHGPVPGYASKLEKSMDRFFARLEVGRAVVRVNWSVMTRGTGLFAAFGGLHDHDHSHSNPQVPPGEGDGEEDSERINPDTFDGTETFLRCERQTLHRLPKSKALLFGFHTYTYPLSDIKEEGLGEKLATAIEGLEGGSVPGVYGYKRGPYWGEAVKRFLRS
ncbi:heme-dependent oxidative N-demethylase family protein [Aspergillus undulatus]|uniref:heme-dependent oxidative N-demethylase family protein n=1 Tax=Aspergillus undulatus TaxID=1810928 RepID=UPI003CCD19E4